ncbi:MAG: CvpA family protein [Flavobacteriales bacterium]
MELNQQLSAFNWLDFLIAIPIAIYMIKGFQKGLVHALASFAGLILGVFGAMLFLDQIRNYLQDHLQLSQSMLTIIAFLIIFSCIVLAVKLLGKILTNLFKAVALGFVNRLAGLIFGFITSFLVVGLAVYALNNVDERFKLLSPETKSESKLYKPVLSVMPKVLSILDMYEWKKILNPNTYIKVDSDQQTDEDTFEDIE